MVSPFEVLGLRAWAEPDEIRAAYRSLVKQCHPDMVQDPDEKKAAQDRMVQLNLAYEEALRLALPRQNPAYTREIAVSEAVQLANRMLRRNGPEAALRQLMRADKKDASWYYTQGKIFMEMNKYNEAHQSFRRAVSMSPDNNEYHAGALDAAVAMKKQGTLFGRIETFLSGLLKKLKITRDHSGRELSNGKHNN